MGALDYLAAGLAGILILMVLVSHSWRRRDDTRRQVEREAYADQQARSKAELSSAAVAQLVAHYFPFVKPAWDASPRMADGKARLRKVLADASAVRLGKASIGVDAILPDAVRRQHFLVLGKSGYGKTTLALHLIRDDLRRGRGLCIIGSEAEFFRDWLLPLVPTERSTDVVYFRPADASCPLTWNPLSLEDGEDQALAAGEMFATFKRAIGEATIGARADAILSSAFAVLVGRPGATLWSVIRLLEDEAYRAAVVAEIEDPYLKSFWSNTFSGYPAGAALPLANRLNQFLRMPQLRAALCHPVSSFSIQQTLSNNQILYLDLSGLDPDTTRLVGQAVLSKFQIELFRRERIPESRRTPVHVYVDEFHAFAGAAEGTWRELLARGRRYGLGLHLLTQHPNQLPKSLQHEIFGNVSSIVALNLSAADAASVRRELVAPANGGATKPVPSEDFVSLPVGEGFARLGAGACALRVRFAPPIDRPDVTHGHRVREMSWKAFAAPPRPKEEAAPKPQPATPARAPSAPAGRGSDQHKMLQQLGKQWGEDRGFRAALEQDVLGGAGRVDLVLERDGTRIAVEICLTNSSAEVVESVGRCLASEFSDVVLVTTDDSARSRYEKAVQGAITSTDRGKVHFLSADSLRRFLDGLSDPGSSEEKPLGYTVRVQAPAPGRLRHRQELARLVGAAILRRGARS